MTTIAWDGRIMAADRQATRENGLISSVQKLWRPKPNIIAGFSGALDECVALKAWFDNGADPKEYPKPEDINDAPVMMFVIKGSSTLFCFEGLPFAIPFLNVPYSRGSGAAVALGAMFMGANAIRALEITSRLDAFTGEGIDWAGFDEEGTLPFLTE